MDGPASGRLKGAASVAAVGIESFVNGFAVDRWIYTEAVRGVCVAMYLSSQQIHNIAFLSI